MSKNDPYAKLGGGALDQELFKNKQTPLSSLTVRAFFQEFLKFINPLNFKGLKNAF